MHVKIVVVAGRVASIAMLAAGCTNAGSQPEPVHWAMPPVASERDPSPPPMPEPTTLQQAEPLPAPRRDPAERWRTRVIRPSTAPETSAPGSDRLIDVDLRNAALGNAFRLLADAGDFALVIDSNVSGNVTVRMERVRPYDALVVIAQSGGAVVRNRGNVVVVTRE